VKNKQGNGVYEKREYVITASKELEQDLKQPRESQLPAVWASQLAAGEATLRKQLAESLATQKPKPKSRL
jgi:hypothetical protein